MFNADQNLGALVHDFSKLSQVDAILLGGSRAGLDFDPASDYDLYIYTNQVIPIGLRKEITDQYCHYMELNNQFWEMEDNGILKKSETPIDLIYRSLDWIDDHLNSLLLKTENIATGYTTAIWYNFIHSVILYERDYKASNLQEKYDLPYPQALKKAILAKNWPLLRDQLPAYYHQIKKALLKKDVVSLNHRTAAFLESYFEILFAINELPHPGEKRILSYLNKNAANLPLQMNDDIQAMLLKTAQKDQASLEIINQLIDRLEVLLKQLELLEK